MARVPRPPFGVLVAVILIGLAALLATLQYQWLGKVSEAEREQLRRSLGQRAREFADDFDLEITRTYLALQASRQSPADDDWSAFAGAYDRWRATARQPALVRTVYLAETDGRRATIRPWDAGARRFAGPASDAWPAHLEPVRRRLTDEHVTIDQPPEARAGGAPATISISLLPVQPDVPALVIPLSAGQPESVVLTDVRGSASGDTARPVTEAVRAAGAGTTHNMLFWMRRPGVFIVADLDADCLRRDVLPTLAARHFPDETSVDYRVGVLSAGGETVFARDAAGAAPLDPARADVVAPFFSLRLDLARDPAAARAATGAASGGRATATPDARRAAPGALPRSGAEGAIEGRFAVIVGSADRAPGGVAATREVRVVRPSWRIVIQHRAGSLDAAVSQVRRRNLAISFGILAVLAAGVVLVAVNARRLEQLAARQMDFVATVTHELRTPLTVIRSAAQNLSAGVVSDSAQTSRYGRLIEAEGRRLTDLVEQVLDYAGLSGGRPLRVSHIVDVGALVTDVVEAHAPAIAQASCAVEVSGLGEGSPGPWVVADEAALRRALNNLIANAITHGADGAWIGVRVATAESRGRAHVEVAISDRGRGIDPADLAHVFEAFYRGRHAVARQVRGNGLGLNLVKRIAEAHGGYVSVRSSPGAGSTFALILPAAAPAPAGAGPSEARP